MVFYFKARPEVGDYLIFMGLDKYENEELIKYGLPEDIWFHVDKMSSAHVYLRLQKGQSMDDIPEGVLEDCVQLVKANSIQGNKVNNVDVVYTPWSNLKKTTSMDVGQVGFYNSKMVRTVKVEKRINEIVNRLNRTKVERTPDLKDESVIALATRCQHLRSLGLYYCQNITDRAMYSLAQSRVRNKHEPRRTMKTKHEDEGLMNLNISQCTALTPPAVQAVCDSFPALHTCPGRHSLIISGCLSLTSVHCACAVQNHRGAGTTAH